MLPHPDGRIFDNTWWDPDGSGPQGPQLVFGGEFRHLGLVAELGLAAWDPATGEFITFAANIQRSNIFRSPVWALDVLPNGDLVVGGAFHSIAGQPIANLAGFDGTNWYSFGMGVDDEVNALEVMPNGDLIATGLFLNAGGAPATRIARWDGTAWHTMGTPNGRIEQLATAPNGDLIAAGPFGGVNGILINHTARWDGATWSPLGLGLGPNTNPSAGHYVPYITDLEVLANGDVLVCGAFDQAGGNPVTRSARWDGTSWSEVNTGGIGGTVDTFQTFYINSTGTLFGVTTQRAVLEWNGTAWSAIVDPLPGWGPLTALPTGELFAAPDQLLPTVQRLMPETTNGFIYATSRTENGELIAAGNFSLLEGVSLNAIARNTGSGWQGFGAGLQMQSAGGTTAGGVLAVLPLPGGELIVGGGFNLAGTVTANNLARWDGMAWSAMGNGIAAGVIEALVQLPNSTIVAGGQFYVPHPTTGWGRGIASWDGSSWTSIGGGIEGHAFCLAVLPNGDLVVGGSFDELSSGAHNLARWDGTTWSAMGNSPWVGINRVTSLLVMTDGTLVGAGILNGSTPIATWDGSTWTTIGTAAGNTLTWLTSLHELPNGDLLVGGLMSSINGMPCGGLARWDGTTWTSENAAINNGWDKIESMTLFGDRLFVGGDFHEIGGHASGFHAYLDTSCPASTTSVGTSCAGATTLTADRPWLGSKWHLRADSLPSPAFVFAAYGQAASNVLLANILTQGVPGCALLVQPDIVDVAFAANGSASFVHDLPSNVSLIGTSFRSQAVPFEVDASGNVLAVTSTNALVMTLGTF